MRRWAAGTGGAWPLPSAGDIMPKEDESGAVYLGGVAVPVEVLRAGGVQLKLGRIAKGS
jgi:hypothetical protein